MYRTFREFPTLKNNVIMENDKELAFTELSFQLSSGKFITVIQYIKPISWNV